MVRSDLRRNFKKEGSRDTAGRTGPLSNLVFAVLIAASTSKVQQWSPAVEWHERTRPGLLQPKERLQLRPHLLLSCRHAPFQFFKPVLDHHDVTRVLRLANGFQHQEA